MIAWNLRHWRQARHMTQEELGALLGWSGPNVSAAESSVKEHRELRRFNAQTIAEIANALHIPIVALFLPPGDDGHGRRYVWHADSAPRDMAALMHLVMPYTDENSDLADEYEDRFRGAVSAYLDEKWGAEVAPWFAPMDDDEARAEQASRFRSRQAVLLRMAAEDGELADYLEQPQEEEQP